MELEAGRRTDANANPLDASTASGPRSRQGGQHFELVFEPVFARLAHAINANLHGAILRVGELVEF